MKSNYLILSIILLFALAANGQENEQNATIRPGKGNVSFELDFLPFSSDGPIRMNALRGRYFISDRMAVNVNFSFDNRKIHNETPSSYGTGSLFDSEEAKFTVFGLGAGLEYHLLNATRVSPYVGLNVAYELKNSHYESVVNTYAGFPTTGYTELKTEIENAWSEYSMIGYDQYGNPVYSYGVSQRGYNSLKVNAVLGADVYIIKHLYMGVELGLGVSSIKYKEVVIKKDGNFDHKYPEATDFDFGLNFNNAIRLGFWF
jgi:hypothetical protein